MLDWAYPPEVSFYLKYKNVYDNPDFFNQLNGKVIYPGTAGNIHTNGFYYGVNEVQTIQTGEIIDRFGSNGDGKYFAPLGTSFEERALPPFMENQPYKQYEVLEPFDVQSGPIAPWFDQLGGGWQ